MNITPVFFGAVRFKPAKVPPRRYGDKFTNPKFRPRVRNKRRYKIPKPKWMK